MNRQGYDEALRHFALGYRHNHLKPNSKEPAYVGYQRRGGFLYELEEDFSYMPDGGNGILTGENRIGEPFGVIDFDEMAVYEAFAAKVRIETTIARTRRGIHVYVRGPVPNRKFEGGDLIGPGKSAVAPLTRIEEHVYEWVTPLRPVHRLAEYDPAWLTFPEAKPQPARPPPISLVSLPDMRRVFRYVDRAEPAISGQRGHAKTFGLACRLLRVFPWLSEEQLTAALNHYNTRCEPPWSPREISHKVRQAIDRTLGGKG